MHSMNPMAVVPKNTTRAKVKPNTREPSSVWGAGAYYAHFPNGPPSAEEGAESEPSYLVN